MTIGLLDNEIESLERNRYRCEECVKLTQETFTQILETMKGERARVAVLERELAKCSPRSSQDCEKAAGLRAEVAIRGEKIAALEEQVAEFQASSMLVTGHGDPGGIKPEHIEKEITGLRAQVVALERELQHRPYWLWHSMLRDVSASACDEHDGHMCSESGDCITEWCLSCSATRYLRDIHRREQGGKG